MEKQTKVSLPSSTIWEPHPISNYTCIEKGETTAQTTEQITAAALLIFGSLRGVAARKSFTPASFASNNKTAIS